MPISNTLSAWAKPTTQAAASTAAPSSGVSTMLVGDSRSAQNYVLHYISSISRTAGVVTVTFTGGALDTPFSFLWKGCPIQVENVPEDLRGKRTITGGSGTTWTFDAPGPDFASYTPAGLPHVMNLAHFASNGYFVRANGRAMGKFDLVDVVASVGRGTDEMVTRLPEALASTAQVVFVLGGINDIMGGSKTAAQILANLKTICTTLQNAGKQVFLLTELPLYGANNTATRAATIAQLNQGIRRFVRDNTIGIRLVDGYPALVNSVNPATTGEAKQYMLGTDNLHPSSRGSDELGKVLIASTSHIPYVDLRISSTSETYGSNTANTNVLDNAPFTAGAVDTPYAGSQVGTGYTGLKEGNSGAVFSVVTRADGLGMNNRVVYTPTADNDGARWLSGNIGSARLKANSKYSSEATVKVTGNTNGNAKTIRHHIIVTLAAGAGTAAISALVDTGETAPYRVQEDVEMVLRTPSVYIAAAPTNIFALTGLASSAAGPAITFEMGRARVDVQPVV